MITSQDVQKLLNKGVRFKKECIALIKEILKQFGATNEDKAFKFSAKFYQAPQFTATNCAFDDGVEVYIEKLWLDEHDDIRTNLVDLNGDEYGYGMLLESVGEPDFADILSWMRNEL